LCGFFTDVVQGRDDHMKNELLEHKLSYFSLITFLLITGFLFLAAWPDVIYQRYLVLLMSVFYLFWGVVVHIKRKEFCLQVLFEYLGVASLSGVLMLLITL
jgi:hypothetical protein